MADLARSLDEGVEAGGSLNDSERKATAYNVLKNSFGFDPGDIDTATKGQNYLQKEKLNPIEVQQAGANLEQTGLQNTGISQTNDYNALANPKKLTGLDLTNENTAATTAKTTADTDRTEKLLPGEVAQQGAALKQTNAQTGYLGAETAHTNAETATSKFALGTAEAAQARQGAMGILAGLSDTASNDGDVGAAFDRYAPLIAKYENVDPAHLPALRAALVADPVGTINKLSDAIHAANLTAMGANGKGGAGALAQLKFSQGQMSLKDGLAFTQQRTAAVPGIAQQMVDLLAKTSDIATVRKAKAMIPGTPEYQFEKLAEQLKSNSSLDDLRSLRAGGLSMGRVTNMEMGMTGNAIAQLDMGQPKATVGANLQRVKSLYGVVNQNLASEVQRIGSGSGAMGVPHVSARAGGNTGGGPVEGQVYVDAKGNKAMYKNGQYVEQK